MELQARIQANKEGAASLVLPGSYQNLSYFHVTISLQRSEKIKSKERLER